MTGSDTPASFRLGYVPGVTPAKWIRTWQERLPEVPLHLQSLSPTEAAEAVRAREVDAALLRLPIDRTDLHAIPLYTENTVVVLPKDHPLTEGAEITAAELADLLVLHALDDSLDWTAPPGQPAKERPETTADAIQLVAAGVGLLIVPQSLARLHHRKDLAFRTLADAPVSQVALSWREDAGTELTEQFIGIVRGRTVNSTRGAGTPAPAPAPAPAKAKKPAPARNQKRAAAPTGRGRKPRRGR
ncbi:LysR family substrate-binding domain-containing protein [Crossiella cryophila]|uniref:DNA-binding transcriptional LysR family regulator n=1 Tax=Crossiella cryophila TaxID=43355 RepID=A0A7W7CFB7_9PSEU|nr:LysR family substrate-binding domain-containing protein [Crossiella cryophila]MBB4680156.1 DNA-binding transcriptional LysR family regulator [Crossiella cryophila]